MAGGERVPPADPGAVVATTTNACKEPPDSKSQKFIKTVAPWVQATSQIATIVALVILVVTFDFNTDVADRVWGAQLIGIIYNDQDCPKRPCEPIASLQAREEAVKAYIALERKYDRRPKLRDVDLIGAVLTNVDFSDVDLPGAKLANATLEGAQFVNANLRGADLSGARLTDANLDRADLSSATVYASLQRATLINVNFKSTKLGICDDFDHASGEGYKSADLRGAGLKNADFGDASLCGVDITDTDLREVQNLTSEQVSSAVSNARTQVPPSLYTEEKEEP